MLRHCYDRASNSMTLAGIRKPSSCLTGDLPSFPDLSKAYYFKGIALYDLGKFEDAIDSYDHAVAIEPDDPNAWYNKAATLAQIGRNEESLQACDRLLSIKWDNAEAWILKGIALYELGRYQGRHQCI